MTHSVAKANALLDQAGFRGTGRELAFTYEETSTESAHGLIAAVLPSNWSGRLAWTWQLELPRFIPNITKGDFQMYPLRWAGAGGWEPRT